jgi:class 3 adenylate cyclase
MAELPTGTVTLVFADIEDSTGLLTALGGGYEWVLSDWQGLLRRRFNLHGGVVVGTEGDSFFVVFRRAKDAAGAAIEVQRAMAAHPWPEGSEVRVRIGMHTGEPSIGYEGLTGLAVHRAARICAAAHGGQILVSNTTADLLEEDALPGLAFHELGEFVLKGFERPARLLQLLAEDLEESFPPPRTSKSDIEADSSARGASRRAVGECPPETDTRRMSQAFRAAVRLLPADELRGAVRKALGGTPIDVIGYRIHSIATLSPEKELAAALRALGGAIVQIDRTHRAVEKRLRSVNRRALERRLEKLRNSSSLSTYDVERGRWLSKQLAAIEGLADVHSEVLGEVARLEERTNVIRKDIFRAQLGDPLPDGLADEVTAHCEKIGSLRIRLRQAEQDAEQTFTTRRNGGALKSVALR